MKAVILAAGIASRLRPLTDNTPKCLLYVGEKNILAYTIDHLIANDISKLIIVTGYLENKIRDFVSAEYPTLNVQYVYNAVYASTNNIYSLWLAKDLLGGDEMLLLDSDILFDKNIITKLLASGYRNCLALKRHAVGAEEIKVKTNSERQILSIGKEIKPDEAAGESIGIERFGTNLLRKLFEIIERKIQIEKNVNQFYEAAFQELMDQGEKVYAVDVTEFACMEIDTPADLDVAGKLMLEKKYL